MTLTVLNRGIKKTCFYTALVIMLAACNLEKEINVPLPQNTNQAVVECYLTPGYPILLLLSETQSYFESPRVPIINDATVIVTHRGVRDTLYNIVLLDTVLTGKVYNYVSLNLVPFHYNEPFYLEIHDPKGRTLMAETNILPSVAIDSIIVERSGDSAASVAVEWRDDKFAKNHYRVTIHDSTLFNRPRRDVFLSDDNYDSEKIRVFTRPNYSIKDTLIVTLHHIDKAHYDFLSSAVDAANANGNPFSVPGRLISNIQGGTGIFTFLSFDRDTLYGLVK